jgi:CheY-like chemotaxis protein
MSFSRRSADAVVRDLGLPGVDGLTLLHQWRATGIAVPVLVLTARASWHEKVRGIDSGAMAGRSHWRTPPPADSAPSSGYLPDFGS